jgi:hypothetical protein
MGGARMRDIRVGIPVCLPGMTLDARAAASR